MISIPAGKALGLYDFAGKELIKLLVLAPIIIPPLAVTMGIHINFIKFGLSDRLLGVIIVHLIPTIPYSIRILTHVFEALGDKLEAQARVLGASGWQTFIHITLPLIYPGIFSAGIMVFIISFSQYFLTFLIGGGQVVSFPMVLFPLVRSGDRMLAAVYSVVFIVAALVFTLVMERLFKDEERTNDHFYL
ncbi:ABC transporter permease [Halobacteroides halobius]|uniref:ABC transporter permease n=1 Tax=Halobacteroides halobius TaxID=42422 RepID=UPI000312050C|nr:ABC transporter permease subunit [Halobacteroides halobius]